MMRKYLMIGASAFLLGAGSMALVNATANATAPKPQAYHMLELFGDVLATVQSQYVTPVDDKKLIESAIDGMLTSLDPHSGYLNADSFDDMRDQTRGEYGGLGLEVTADDGVVKVISPMDDTPAARAGIKAGDYITAIDGQSVLGLPLDEAVKQMRGEVGQAITLSIAREKHDPFDVKLVREDHRGEVGEVAHGRRLRLSAHLDLQREDRPGDGGRGQVAGGQEPQDEGAGARPCATTPAACSTRRWRCRTCSWTAARWSPSAAATRRTSSATTPAPATCCTACRSSP